jgi:hypothetical protein
VERREKIERGRKKRREEMRRKEKEKEKEEVRRREKEESDSRKRENEESDSSKIEKEEMEKKEMEIHKKGGAKGGENVDEERQREKTQTTGEIATAEAKKKEENLKDRFFQKNETGKQFAGRDGDAIGINQNRDTIDMNETRAGDSTDKTTDDAPDGTSDDRPFELDLPETIAELTELIAFQERRLSHLRAETEDLEASIAQDQDKVS